MRSLLDVVRSEPGARRFLLAHAQSALGTGAAYVALLVIAAQSSVGAWGVSAVLLAEWVPAMLLGTWLGGLSDRLPRRPVLVAADAVCAVAFVALAFADGLVPIVLCALVAGIARTVWLPAALAGVPELVPGERVPAMTAAYTTLGSAGMLLGPALAGLALALAGPALVLAANALTFAVSAVLIGGVRFGRAAGAGAEDGPAGIVGPVPLRTVLRQPAVPGVLVAATVVVLLMGFLNVAEPLVITDVLGAPGATYGVFVALFGLGATLGSLLGTAAGTPARMRFGFLAGLVALTAGFAALAAASSLAVGLAAATLLGVGDGLVLVHQRLLLQTVAAPAVRGRLFGLVDALAGWAMATAFLSAAGLMTAVGVRVVVAGMAVAAAVVVAAGLAAHLHPRLARPVPAREPVAA